MSADVYGRPTDNLLGRPDLQALVDAQVLRRPAVLTEALGHSDPVVRARAAFALGSVQDAEAVPALLGVLSDPDPRVRADAAFAIGQSADSTASLALINALDREEDATVVAELLDALGKTGSSASLAALATLDLPASSHPAARAMAIARYGLRGIYNETTTAWAAGRLRDGSVLVREGTAYLFGRARSADVWRQHADAVRDALRQGDFRYEAHMALVSALARLREAQDVPRVSYILGVSADWRLRVTAARTLPAFAEVDPSVWSTLAEALDDPNDHVARTAADALAGAESLPPAVVTRVAEWIGDNRDRTLVVGSLLPALARAGRAGEVLTWLDGLRRPAPASRSRRGDVVATHYALGITALGVASDASSLNRLFASARDRDPRVAYAAIEALKTRWAGGRESADAALTRRYYDAFAAAVGRRDLATTTSAAPALADSLFRPYDPGTLLRETYARMEAPRDIEPMVEIVRAAGQIRDGSEVDFLVSVAMTGHPVLRQAADAALDDRLHEGIDVDATNPVPPSTVLIEWDYVQELGRRPLLVLETDRGTIVVEMDTEQAPQTVMKLAKTAILGQFNDVPFHRVVPNFVIQGGDFFRRDGYGGPDVNLRSEFTRMRYTAGTAGMASAGKDTEGVQYFFTHSATPHLDGRYTAFGRIVDGQEVADAIQPGELVRRAWIVRTSERRPR
jgi:peptidylprolyl isomerase